MTESVAAMKVASHSDKEPASERESSLNDEQGDAIRQVANTVHRLNLAVMAAVESGVSVELVRSSRHHCGKGNWGDLMVPVIVKR